MSTSHRSETLDRRQTMLRAACRGVVREALEADDVIEILANADGRIWIERAGQGVGFTDEALSAEARERIIRLLDRLKQELDAQDDRKALLASLLSDAP